MKVKISETGEIKAVNHGKVLVHFSDGTTKAYESIGELSNDLSDYEEPIVYWLINPIKEKPYRVDGNGKFRIYNDEEIAKFEEAGFLYKTEEEAEKALEKLKAITRLNKCGFKFEGYADRDRAKGGDIVIYAHVDIPNNNLLEEAQPAMLKDLDLLFSGEEG